MTFSSCYKKEQVHEWREAYIDYESLRLLLRRLYDSDHTVAAHALHEHEIYIFDEQRRESESKFIEDNVRRILISDAHNADCSDNNSKEEENSECQRTSLPNVRQLQAEIVASEEYANESENDDDNTSEISAYDKSQRDIYDLEIGSSLQVRGASQPGLQMPNLINCNIPPGDGRVDVLTAFLCRLQIEVAKADLGYSTLLYELKSKLDSSPNASARQLEVLYARANSLLSFAYWNFRACQVIASRWSFKSKSSKNGEHRLMSRIRRRTAFMQQRQLAPLINSIIVQYAALTEKGHRSHAKIALLNAIDTPPNPTFTRRSALMCIASVIILLLVIMERTGPDMTEEAFKILHWYAPVYRIALAFSALLALWSATLHILTRHRINYSFVFGVGDQKSHVGEPSRLRSADALSSSLQLFAFSSLNLAVFLWIATANKNSTLLGKRASLAPLSLFFFMLVRLFLPYESLLTPHWETRKLMLRTLRNIVITPLGHLSLREAFIGDFMTSLIKVFADLCKTVCVTVLHNSTSGSSHCKSAEPWLMPLLSTLPLFWRFVHCMKIYATSGGKTSNLFSALKYSLSHFVLLFGLTHDSYSNGRDNNEWSMYRSLWLFSVFCSTIYSWSYEVTQDWGLGKGLRPQRLYGGRLRYYIAAIINLLLRFYWTLSLIPIEDNIFYSISHESSLHQFLLIPCLIVLEIFRRCLWALFRIENAHLGAGDEFDSHRVPLPLFLYSSLHRDCGNKHKNNVGEHLCVVTYKKSKKDVGATRRTLLEALIIVLIASVVTALAMISDPQSKS